MKPLFRPVLLAMVCGLTLGYLFYMLAPHIHESREAYETAQLHAVHGLTHVYLEKQNDSTYLIRSMTDDKLLGQIRTAETATGYNGRISAWVGVDNDKKILGVRVREHRETPGLGDKIDRQVSNWIDQFKGLSLKKSDESDLLLRRNGGRIDQITGATITSRAMVRLVINSNAGSNEPSGGLPRNGKG